MLILINDPWINNFSTPTSDSLISPESDQPIWRGDYIIEYSFFAILC